MSDDEPGTPSEPAADESPDRPSDEPSDPAADEPSAPAADGPSDGSADGSTTEGTASDDAAPADDSSDTTGAAPAGSGDDTDADAGTDAGDGAGTDATGSADATDATGSGSADGSDAARGTDTDAADRTAVLDRASRDGQQADEAPVDGFEDLGSEVGGDLEVDEEAAEDDLLGGLRLDSTADVSVPDRLVDQVIGQDEARDIIKKAAKQHRHVMMIGSPGTGKSMLAKSMSQLLPNEELQDVLVYHNPDDGNEPKIRTVPAGKGEQIVEAHKEEARK
ncbi:MAG: ATP-binding protein, partial [Halobacteriaceae archaeon]